MCNTVTGLVIRDLARSYLASPRALSRSMRRRRLDSLKERFSAFSCSRSALRRAVASRRRLAAATLAARTLFRETFTDICVADTAERVEQRLSLSALAVVPLAEVGGAGGAPCSCFCFSSSLSSARLSAFSAEPMLSAETVSPPVLSGLASLRAVNIFLGVFLVLLEEARDFLGEEDGGGGGATFSWSEPAGSFVLNEVSKREKRGMKIVRC